MALKGREEIYEGACLEIGLVYAANRLASGVLHFLPGIKK
jgi:hypothetical protein